MASITNPSTQSGSNAQSPITGIIRFSADEGKFFRHYPAVVENGVTVKDKATVEVRNPKFMIVSVNFFRVVGGKPNPKNRDEFIPVSSPIICTDKGFGWDQYVPVWVGRGNKTPAFLGKWSEIKEQVQSKEGKYAELLFVVAADWPKELLLLELTGYSISQLGDAVKGAGYKYKSDLVTSTHTLEMVNTAKFEVNRREYMKPVFQVQKFGNQNKGYDAMFPILMDFSAKLDVYSDAIAANQKGPQTGSAAPVQTATDERFPAIDSAAPASRQQFSEPFPLAQADTPTAAADYYDDLPF